jgi:hypothetical protein
MDQDEDHEGAADLGVPAGFDGGGRIAALRAHARNEQGHGGRNLAHALDLGRVGGAGGGTCKILFSSRSPPMPGSS